MNEIENLCICNMCGTIMINENPDNAPQLPVSGNEEKMEWMEDEYGEFWGCPHCKTDAYLSDLPIN